MKFFTLSIILFISVFTFAQNTGSINGKLLDLESNKEPMLYAKVLIKETVTEISTNEKGSFKFEKLKDGNYTIAASFIGYDPKTISVKVQSGKPTNVKLFLKASTVSLDELVLTLANTNEENASTTLE